MLSRFNFSRAISVSRVRAACSTQSTSSIQTAASDKHRTHDNTTKKTYYIGLDVHKDSIAIAYTASRCRKDAVYYGSCGGINLALERALRKLGKKLGVPFKELKICYEAGPTGFFSLRKPCSQGFAIPCALRAKQCDGTALPSTRSGLRGHVSLKDRAQAQ